MKYKIEVFFICFFSKSLEMEFINASKKVYGHRVSKSIEVSINGIGFVFQLEAFNKNSERKYWMRPDTQ